MLFCVYGLFESNVPTVPPNIGLTTAFQTNSKNGYCEHGLAHHHTHSTGRQIVGIVMRRELPIAQPRTRCVGDTQCILYAVDHGNWEMAGKVHNQFSVMDDLTEPVSWRLRLSTIKMHIMSFFFYQEKFHFTRSAREDYFQTKIK